MAAPTIGRRRWLPRISATVDWSHPSATGLLHAISGQGIDHVTRFGPSTQLQTPGTTPLGQSFVNGSASQYTEFPSRNNLAAGDLTTIIVQRFNSLPDNNYNNLGFSKGSGREFALYVNGAAGTPGLIRFVHIGSAFNDVTSLGLMTVGVTHVVAVTRTVSSGALVGWVDGARTASASTNTGVATTGSLMRWGTDINGTLRSASDHVFQMFWNRVLSATEIAAFTADPFLLLRY